MVNKNNGDISFVYRYILLILPKIRDSCARAVMSQIKMQGLNAAIFAILLAKVAHSNYGVTQRNLQQCESTRSGHERSAIDRTLVLESRAHAGRYEAVFRGIPGSRSMGRNNGCKVRLFRIPGFLLGNVMLMREMLLRADASTNMTGSDSIDGRPVNRDRRWTRIPHDSRRTFHRIMRNRAGEISYYFARETNATPPKSRGFVRNGSYTAFGHRRDKCCR